jgi:D-alanyl-lipoteichoic acid acyltransferase DltB (MBOAT superfamily)
MFFTTYSFIFGFLPLTLLGFHACRRSAWPRAATWWLLCMSLAFYWSLERVHLGTLLASIAVNYVLGRQLHRLRAAKSRHARPLFVASVALNALLLVGFKYGAPAIGWELPVPLGLSFFTLLQIGYHIAIYTEKTRSFGFPGYALFVGYFPYVVAGPIVHKREFPFADGAPPAPFDPRLFLAGLALFVFGLCKKLLLADSLVADVNAGFDANAAGTPLSSAEAWIVAPAYVLQLYFDFSAYSDMAAGISAMLGFRLPRNFHSPLKATSISEYWRRWHITVTRFFTNNLYLLVTLKLTRYARAWRLGPRAHFLLTVFSPLLIAFTLIGVWHGSGANFLWFGLLMASALSVHQARVRARRPALFGPAGWALTMLVVIAGMILDKTVNLQDALRLFASLAGAGPGAGSVLQDHTAGAKLLVLGLVALALPNTHQILSRYQPVLPDLWNDAQGIPEALTWKLSTGGLLTLSVALAAALAAIPRAAEFIYYRF